MTVKRLFRDISSYMPLFVRRFLTKKKIQKMLAFMIPEKEVMKCDRDPGYKEKLLSTYKKRFPKEAKWLDNKCKKVIELCPRFKDFDEKACSDIQKQLEYAFFGYGFYPDECVFFDLVGTNNELDRFRSFVSETERWSFRFAANDFSNSLFSDKADTYKKFKRFFKRDALVVDDDKALQEFIDFTKRHSRFVYKKVSSSRGDGVRLINGIENAMDFFKKMRSDGKVLLEECIEQSTEMSAFNPSSVNTIRLSTYNTRNGIQVVHGFFRSGRAGAFVDNAAKGGIFAPLDVNNGHIDTDGFDEYGGRYIVHPDSGVKFAGYAFPDWDEAKRICKAIASEMTSVKYISFDLTHTCDGWVIVEINSSGQFLHQTGKSKGFRDELHLLINEMDLMTPYKLREYNDTIDL